MSELNDTMPDFEFVGDFDFSGDDAWLQFRIPMPVLQALLAGPQGRHITITREEILSLLRVIDRNSETSQPYLEIVRSLLSKRRR
jgi:hypothetical protein